MQWWYGSNGERRRVPQCQLIKGFLEEGVVAYTEQVRRYTHQPYTVTYSHPTDTITRIACVPVDAETQSPEAEVTEGGVDCNHATIRLTAVEEGEWACKVTICTKLSSVTPAKEVTVRQLLGLLLCYCKH
jgi:hypothetical protein